MRIKAKTKWGAEVIIIAFVSKYNATYAAAIDKNGRIWDFPIEDLTVIDPLEAKE